MNKTLLTGRLTKDPELRYTQSGMATVKFTLAVNRNQKDANGNYMADFIPCAAFGGQADYIGKYCHKGNMLGITGRIQTGSYQGQDGQTHYTEDVIVEGVENLTPRDTNNAPAQQSQANNQYRNPQYGQPQTPPQQAKPSPGYNQQSYNPNNTPDDDVPF